MSDWANSAITATAICGIVAGSLAIIPMSRIARELQRAREAGEIDLPSPARGIPLQVVVIPNILPRVEKDRQILVKRGLVFLICVMASLGMAAISGLHR